MNGQYVLDSVYFWHVLLIVDEFLGIKLMCLRSVFHEATTLWHNGHRICHTEYQPHKLSIHSLLFFVFIITIMTMIHTFMYTFTDYYFIFVLNCVIASVG